MGPPKWSASPWPSSITTNQRAQQARMGKRAWWHTKHPQGCVCVGTCAYTLYKCMFCKCLRVYECVHLRVWFWFCVFDYVSVLGRGNIVCVCVCVNMSAHKKCVIINIYHNIVNIGNINFPIVLNYVLLKKWYYTFLLFPSPLLSDIPFLCM